MATIVQIDNRIATRWVDLRSIEIADGAQSQGDSLSFTSSIPFSDLTAGLVFKPRPGNVVIVWVNGTKFFEGPVVNVVDHFLTSRAMEARAECSDYTFFLDRKFVTKVEYPAATARARIEAILQEFATEFTGYAGWNDSIATGPSLPAEGYDYEQISSVMDKICEATGHGWHVGFDANVVGRPKLHFYTRLSFESPLRINYNNILNLDTNLEIGGVEVAEDVSDLHNVVIVKDYSEKKTDPYSHQWRADGYQTFFKLPMEPFSVQDTKVSVQQGRRGAFIPRTVALDPLTGEEGEIVGTPGYAYLCILNWGVRFPTSDFPAAGDIVKIDYNYVVPDRIIPLYDRDSINEMARRQGNDGEHHVVVSLPDYRVDGSAGMNAAEAYGRMILERHAWPEISGSFTIFEPSPTTAMIGWTSGQSFRLSSAIRDIYDVRHWVRHGRGDVHKVPVTVWITDVSRNIVQTISPTSTRMETKVSFSTVPRK